MAQDFESTQIALHAKLLPEGQLSNSAAPVIGRGQKHATTQRIPFCSSTEGKVKNRSRRSSARS